MDNLRQIEDELRAFANDVDKKYPEVLDACSRALHTLKSIRESYISNIRKKDSKLPTPCLSQSSDLLAPFILLCNYSDASNRLVTAAIHNISLQIQYDVVPYGEIKNIIRVLSIQTQSSKFDGHVKLLQLVVLLAAFMIKGRNVDGTLSDHSTMLLLNLPLTFNDAKLPASVRNTAYSTVKQVLSLILEEILQQTESSDWLTNSTIMFFEEMIKLASNSALDIGNTSKSANTAYSLALDCIVEICDTVLQVRYPYIDMQRRILKLLIPFIETQLRDVRKIFDAEYQSHGSSSAISLSSRIFRIVRWIVQVNLQLDFESLSHIFILLFHCIQPSHHDSDTIHNRKSKFSHESDSNRTSKYDDPSNIFSKFTLNLTISNVLSRGAFALSESATTNGRGFSYHNDPFYIEFTPRSYNSGGFLNSSSSVDSVKYLPIHPLISSLEIFVVVARKLSSQPPSVKSIKLVNDVLVNCSTLLISSATTVLQNSHIDAHDESSMITALRKLTDIQLSNPFSSIDELYKVIDEICENINNTNLHSYDVICMTILCIELMLRNLLLWSFYQLVPRKFYNLSNRYLPLPSEAQAFVSTIFSGQNMDCTIWIDDLKRTCESSYDGIIDCSTLLLKGNSPYIVQNSGIVFLHEICLILGALNMGRQSEIAISALCKQSLPIWHEKDLLHQENGSSTPSRSNKIVEEHGVDNSKFDVRHCTLFTCLLRVTHVLGNVLCDWDCIVDCFEQVYTRSRLSEASYPVDTAKISKELQFFALLIDRFPLFTVSLCDDNLVKFMTSLVALSMNSLTSESKKSSMLSSGTETFHGDIINVIEASGNITNRDLPTYIERGMQDKTINFSFKLAMETAKLNSFRIASIWQMIISHIRMMAAMKNPYTRTMAIIALFDIMLSSVKLHGSSIGIQVAVMDLECHDRNQNENCYLPRELIFKLEDVSRIDIQLRKNLKLQDLFSCLKSTAAINFPDVRLNLLKGLKLLMQENNDVLGYGDKSGWKVIIEILSSIPFSSLSDLEQHTWLQSSPAYEETENINDPELPLQLETGWPISSLPEGFNCLKLIVDEFLSHFLPDTRLVNILFECLSLYGAQTSDLNMALTAVELLWKVCDAAINSKSKSSETVEEILHLMLVRLFHLSMDLRPEIRNCAVNTFFSSTTAYAFFIKSDRYRYIFHEMIAPWFNMSESKMLQESSSNNPEKISGKALHHSRDSPLKQWSETRVLAIRGLLRLVRSCVKIVMLQNWFIELWNEILCICIAVVFSVVSTLEQSTSSIDLYFGMMSITIESLIDVADISGKIASIEQVERRKQDLWSTCLSYLPSICLCATSYPDLTITMCQKLGKLYSERKDAEFRYSENMKLLCWSIAALSRPIRDSSQNSLGYNNENQLTRSIVELLKLIQINDGNRSVIETYVSSLLEIVLAVQSQLVISSKLDHPLAVLPASESLRNAAAELCHPALPVTAIERTKLGAKRQHFISLLSKQFLESVGYSRMGFFSKILRDTLKEQCASLREVRSVDRVVPIIGEDKYCEVVAWGFFFPQQLHVLNLFSDTLANENVVEGLQTTDAQIEFSLSVGFMLTPWPVTLQHVDTDAALRTAYSSFIKVIMCNQCFSEALKNRILQVVMTALLDGLMIQQMYSDKLCTGYIEVLCMQLSTFLDTVKHLLRQDSDQCFPSYYRLYIALVIIARQLCNVVLTSQFCSKTNDCLMMYLETLSEFDPLVSEFSLRDTEKSIGWALTARDSSNSIELMEEMWSQMLLNNDRTPALLKRGHGQFSTAAVCLYNHLIDMASVDGIRGDVRKSSLQLLRALNAMQLAQSWNDTVVINEQLQNKCEELIQEVHQARSAAAFPF